MQMSAFSIQTPLNPAGSHPGFSLLEMLTVLFIIGTAAALVTPNLPLLFDRITFASQRDSLIREINSLPYKALGTNQNLVLSESSLNERREQLSTSLTQPDDNLRELQKLAPYPISYLALASIGVPDGWRVRIPDPIYYRASGFCSGGTVILVAGRLQYELSLRSPYCQVSGQEL